MNEETKRSKSWNSLVEILEKEFPKGECSERGHALVLLAYAEMSLQESEEKLKEILLKLDSIAGSGDLEAIKKELKNLLDVLKFR